jgi:pimeloyl-ACP methyl ester carboxylesterase
VAKIALLGPMGITTNTGTVVLKLTLFTFYPVEPFKVHMTSWSLGEDASLEWCLKYFRLVLDGVQGRFYRPMTFKPEELHNVQAPVLLILGEKDNLVGDPVKVSQYAHNVPDIQVETLDTSHLIGVEQPDKVNQLVLEFFER